MYFLEKCTIKKNFKIKTREEIPAKLQPWGFDFPPDGGLAGAVRLLPEQLSGMGGVKRVMDAGPWYGPSPRGCGPQGHRRGLGSRGGSWAGAQQISGAGM